MKTRVRNEIKRLIEGGKGGGEEGRRMYLGPIYWIMDNSSLRLLEEEWREKRTWEEK